jgi:LPXTG-site transpeptidase (sortase) family protein
VKIDKLNLEATVGLLGLDEDTGELQVPAGYDEVGWYIYSPTPGEPGPAVILGHVDSYTGPAIFYSLGQLENGDQIAVQNNIGETHMFEVYKQTYYDQDNFATDEVYGNTSGPELRLITCSGEYDREAKRYTENLVIYAKAISA